MADDARLAAITTVVVGTDGSSGAGEAMAWALEDAHRREVPLHVLTAWSPSRDPQETQWLSTMGSVSELRSTVADELTATVSSAIESANQHEVSITTRVAYGHPAKALIEESGPDRLLVVGSRGRGALSGLMLGSVSQACAQYARGPIVVVRGSTPTAANGRVVVGVDGSAESLVGLQFAAADARRRAGPLQVVHVWQDTDHAAHGRLIPPGKSAKEQADQAWHDILRAAVSTAADIEIISKHVAGYAPSVLVKESSGAALLVVGSRGLGGWAGLMLGSVSLHCITRSACPVAVVRDPTTAQNRNEADGSGVAAW
jgi:nucleotide-binding universal stress UspA family protein